MTATQRNALIFAMTLHGDGSGEQHERLEDEGAPRWLHFDFTVPGAAAQLLSIGLDDLVVENLTRPETRPRAFALGEAVLGALRAINLNPGDEPDDMVSLRFWVRGNTLITVRQRQLQSVQQLRLELLAGTGPNTIGELIAALLTSMTDRISEFCEGIETRMQTFEEDGGSDTRQGLALMRRQLARVRRFLSPQRDAIEALARVSRGPLSEEDRFALREQADRTARYVEDIDLLRERAQMLQEARMNALAAQQNARMYVLSMVTAVFLPMSFVTGVMGMNVGGLPGVDSDMGFAIVCGLMTGFGAGIVLLLRWLRWF